MGENQDRQDRTHEATHNANTIACSAGGCGSRRAKGSRPQLGECSASSDAMQWDGYRALARQTDKPTAAASTAQMSRPD
jgi:hypothetical protein